MDVLICVGDGKAIEIDKWMKKNGSKEAKTLMTKENIDYYDKMMEGSTGFMTEATHEKNKKKFYIMWLKEWKHEWYPAEVLMHEINHLKQFVFENKGIEDEREMESYFLESTFRTLRRRLFKEIKIKK